MQRYLGILACALMVACGGDDGEGGDTGATTATGTPNGCANEIVETFPESGASDVYYRTTVEFTLETVSGSETITVSAGGADVAGSTSIVDNRVIWTAAAPLAANTTHDVTLDWECGPTTTSWTTSDVGDAVDDAGLVGKAYTLDIATGRFVQPPGVGPLIQQQLDQDILIGVTSASGGTIEMMGALADGSGGQDVCTASIEFPVPADFSENPYFSVESESLELDIEGIVINIDDLMVSGAFSPDASSIEGAVLSGAIDTRALLDLVGGTDDGDVCELVATFGVACEECSDGSGAYCLSVFVDSMVAELAPGVTLQVITSDDVAANPGCAGTTP